MGFILILYIRKGDDLDRLAAVPVFKLSLERRKPRRIDFTVGTDQTRKFNSAMDDQIVEIGGIDQFAFLKFDRSDIGDMRNVQMFRQFASYLSGIAIDSAF